MLEQGEAEIRAIVRKIRIVGQRLQLDIAAMSALDVTAPSRPDSLVAVG
jgi:hypothetical protein